MFLYGVIYFKIMKARDNLKKIHPKCCLHNLGYRKGYAVYDTWDKNRITLGYGNTPKNAYSNALYNCTK